MKNLNKEGGIMIETVILPIIVIAVSVLSTAAIVLFANWRTHIAMTDDECLRKGFEKKRVTFKYFLIEFEKVRFIRNIEFPYSFLKEVTVENSMGYYKDIIHCGRIVIDSTGLQFNFAEYIKFLIWINKNKYKGE